MYPETKNTEIALPTSPTAAHIRDKGEGLHPGDSSLSEVPETEAAGGSDTDEEEAESQLRVSTLLPLILFFLCYLIFVVLFTIYRKRLFPLIDDFKNWVRAYGIYGGMGITLIVGITAFPPVPAYSFMSVLCGVIYGWHGCIPFFIGAVLGADLVFIIFRKYCHGYSHRLINEHPKVSAVVRAVERRGLKLLFFIRLAPYPFSLMNAILAGSRVKFIDFHLATMFTVPKLVVNVGLGAHLTDIAQFFEHISVERLAMFTLLSMLSGAVFLYILWIGVKEIRLLEKEGAKWSKKERRWVSKSDSDSPLV